MVKERDFVFFFAFAFAYDIMSLLDMSILRNGYFSHDLGYSVLEATCCGSILAIIGILLSRCSIRWRQLWKAIIPQGWRKISSSFVTPFFFLIDACLFRGSRKLFCKLK